jgi:hypothetical protein
MGFYVIEYRKREVLFRETIHERLYPQAGFSLGVLVKEFLRFSKVSGEGSN